MRGDLIEGALQLSFPLLVSHHVLGQDEVKGVVSNEQVEAELKSNVLPGSSEESGQEFELLLAHIARDTLGDHLNDSSRGVSNTRDAMDGTDRSTPSELAEDMKQK